jgi:hypothetical protein
MIISIGLRTVLNTAKRAALAGGSSILQVDASTP